MNAVHDHARTGRFRLLARWWVPMLLVLLVATCGHASGHATWRGVIDEVPVWITVVPRGHDIEPAAIESEPWWRWGNTTTDAYVFAFGEPRNVHLVLSFSLAGDGTPTAELFTSPSPLAPQLEAPGLGLSIRPAFTLRAHGGHWTIEGETNYDLSLWQDGLGPSHPLVTNGLLAAAPDGRFDAFVRVGGEPGRPKWQTWRILSDPRPNWSYTRFDARLRMQDALPFQTVEPFMPGFPHVGVGTQTPDVLTTHPPPFMFDPEKRTLTFHHMVGFQGAGMYWVNSTTFPPDVGFEAPFAFYGFDDQTRQSHLVVRAQNSGGPDSNLGGRHRTTFRYAWKVDESFWKYAFFVAGFHEYDDEIVLGDERFSGIAPERLPTWVTERAWPVVTFVEAMDTDLGSAMGSEGIYFFNVPQANAIVPWLSGVSENVPIDFTAPYLPDEDVLDRFSEVGVPVGYRGQFNAAYFRTPEFVFNPIDRALHLAHHTGGVWNLGGGRVLRYHNLAEGVGTDGWTRERVFDPGEEAVAQTPFFRAYPGVVEAALYAFDGHLLYAGDDEVVLLERREDHAVVPVEPPTDRVSWMAFRRLHGRHAGEPRDPHDLKSWLDAFDGVRSTRTNVRLEDYRVTATGVRFELVVEEGVERGEAVSDVLRSMAPGRHTVRYDTRSGSWTREEARPSALSVSLTVAEPRPFSPARVTLEIHNLSNLDVADRATVEIDGFQNSWDLLLVPDSSQVVVEVSWIPQREGLVPAHLEFGGQVYDLGPIEVAWDARAQGAAALAVSPGGAPVAALALFGFVALGALAAGWWSWRRT